MIRILFSEPSDLEHPVRFVRNTGRDILGIWFEVIPVFDVYGEHHRIGPLRDRARQRGEATEPDDVPPIAFCQFSVAGYGNRSESKGSLSSPQVIGPLLN